MSGKEEVRSLGPEADSAKYLIPVEELPVGPKQRKEKKMGVDLIEYLQPVDPPLVKNGE